MMILLERHKREKNAEPNKDLQLFYIYHLSYIVRYVHKNFHF